MEHNTPDGRTIKPPDRERVVDARHTPEIHAASGHEKLLKAEDLEAWLNIDVKTIYAYARRDGIPHIRIQRSIRFRPSEIREWLNNHSCPNRKGRKKQ